MVWIAFSLSLLSLSVIAGNSSSILQPPSITVPDRPQTLYYAYGERVLVKCSAEGTPSPEYEWQRNEQVIDGNNEFIKFDSRTGTLEIPSFTNMEEGVFVCRASNLVGGNVAVSFSHPQTLIETRVGSFKKRDVDKPDQVNSNEYAYARMRCTDQGEVVGDPNDITYEWYITQGSRKMSTDDGRLFISSDGTLHFTYTLTRDELEGEDTYHCGISSLKSRLIRLGPPMILKVQESSPTALKPVMMYSNNGIQAILSTTAELECVFSGYDPASDDKLPEIKWFDHAGNPIVSDGKKYTLKDKNRILRVADVQEYDDNNFGCQGFTSAGSSRVHIVYLNVTSAPIWMEAPKSATVPEGSDVEIHCDARSLSAEEPPQPPVWYINGQLFEDVGKPNAVLSNERKIMTLSKVTKSNDILCVQCMVKNSIGQTIGHACVNVKDLEIPSTPPMDRLTTSNVTLEMQLPHTRPSTDTPCSAAAMPTQERPESTPPQLQSTLTRDSKKGSSKHSIFRPEAEQAETEEDESKQLWKDFLRSEIQKNKLKMQLMEEQLRKLRGKAGN